MLKFLLVVAVVAVAVYLAVRVLQRRAAGGGPSGGRPVTGPRRPGPRPRPRIVAPDDDEDFLRDIDRKRLHGESEDPDQQ